MVLIKNTEFVCIDCEATGLDLDDDRIVEVAVVRFTLTEELNHLETLVDPERPIPAASMEIHHITDGMVAGKPKISDVLPTVLRLIGNRIIVGHGIEFDINMIANEAKRHNIPCTIKSARFFDTLRLARQYGGSPTNSLERLREHFNIPEEGAHRAMNDVRVNMEVFKQLIKTYKTIEQIFDILAKPIRLKSMPFGKHRGRAMKEVPIEYLQWVSNKDFDKDLIYSIRWELKRRTQTKDFSQSSNPFHGL